MGFLNIHKSATASPQRSHQKAAIRNFCHHDKGFSTSNVLVKTWASFVVMESQIVRDGIITTAGKETALFSSV